MTNINDLIEKTRSLPMTSLVRAEQRRNFAFGSSNIENERITRETVIRAETELLDEKKRISFQSVKVSTDQ